MKTLISFLIIISSSSIFCNTSANVSPWPGLKNRTLIVQVMKSIDYDNVKKRAPMYMKRAKSNVSSLNSTREKYNSYMKNTITDIWTYNKNIKFLTSKEILKLSNKEKYLVLTYDGIPAWAIHNISTSEWYVPGWNLITCEDIAEYNYLDYTRAGKKFYRENEFSFTMPGQSNRDYLGQDRISKGLKILNYHLNHIKKGTKANRASLNDYLKTNNKKVPAVTIKTQFKLPGVEQYTIGTPLEGKIKGGTGISYRQSDLRTRIKLAYEGRYNFNRDSLLKIDPTDKSGNIAKLDSMHKKSMLNLFGEKKSVSDSQDEEVLEVIGIPGVYTTQDGQARSTMRYLLFNPSTGEPILKFTLKKSYFDDEKFTKEFVKTLISLM